MNVLRADDEHNKLILLCSFIFLDYEFLLSYFQRNSSEYMGIIFSRQCEYALQAVVYLAKKPNEEKTTLKEISSRLKIPHHFIGKILQDLTYKGLLTSLKGPTGGFGLARSAKNISLFNIVEAIDGTSLFNACVMGFSECGGKNPCSVHNQWERQKDGIYKMLVNKSIYDMVADMEKQEYK